MEIQHQRNVGARFSAAADTYLEASLLQDRVARHVINNVSGTVNPGCVFDAGCGPGRLLVKARQRWPEAELLGVDIAPGMVEKAREVFSGDSRATFKEGDMGAYPGEKAFDLVISSSSLQWLRPFDAGFKHVVNLCKPGGYVSVGFMLDGTLGELREARRAVAPQKEALGRLPLLREVEAVVKSLPGYHLHHLEQTPECCYEASGAAVLRYVHDTGVTGGDVSRGEAPLTRREIRALAEWYDQHYLTTKGAVMTFEVAYVVLERQ
jgi:malonyl-CoA O-methyltransferase